MSEEDLSFGFDAGVFVGGLVCFFNALMDALTPLESTLVSTGVVLLLVPALTTTLRVRRRRRESREAQS